MLLVSESSVAARAGDLAEEPRHFLLEIVDARATSALGRLVLALDPDNLDLSGNVTAKFTKLASSPY